MSVVTQRVKVAMASGRASMDTGTYLANHDRRQAIKSARFREFVFLDLASQAVTLYVRQRDEAKAAKK